MYFRRPCFDYQNSCVIKTPYKNLFYIRFMNCLFLQGLPGSGKTTLAGELSRRWGWQHLDRDDMDTLHVLDEDEERALAYERLSARAIEALDSGGKIIIDSPFLREDDEEFSDWIESLGVPIEYRIVWLQVGAEERGKRRRRRGAPHDLNIDNWESFLDAEDRNYGPRSGAIIIPAESISLRAQSEICSWLVGEEGRKVVEAGPQNLAEVHEVKHEMIASVFPDFLGKDKTAKEMERVASEEAVQDLLDKSTVLFATKHGKPWALCCLKGLEKGEAVLFSAYSRGDWAGVALATILISRARAAGAKRIKSWVYAGNEVSKKLQRAYGFYPDGEHHLSSATGEVVEHWQLDF